MALPSISLLLLLAQAAAADPDAPVKTVAPEAAAAPAALSEYTPAGAPKDDYAFVAWCEGVLAGHMDIAMRVQDVLPLDDVQQKVGKAYLKAYETALTKGEGVQSAETLQEAETARQTGWMNWEPVRKADKQLAADSYLAWQLPGRCEHAAVRVAGDPNLFKMAPTLDEVVAAGVDAPLSSGAQAALPEPAAPAPAPTAAATAPNAEAGAPALAAVEPAKEEPAPVVAAAAEPVKAEAAPAEDGRIKKTLLRWFRKK